MPTIVDPPEAPESGGGVKARDLLNHAIILLPLKVRVAHDKKKDEDFEIVDCHFWRLESSGVAEDGETGISWWRAREQLRNQIGSYVACRPKQQDDNSIMLVKLDGQPREIAAKVVANLSLPVDETPPADDWDEDGSEPF